MNELKISPDFTVADIHKIREYSYELTKNMSTDERKEYYNKSSMNAQKRIEKIRAEMCKKSE